MCGIGTICKVLPLAFMILALAVVIQYLPPFSNLFTPTPEYVEHTDDKAGTEQPTSALQKIKNSLYSVKVSRHDATEVQRKLEGELLSKLNDSFEVMEAKGIPVAKIEQFLDHLVDTYEGIDQEMRKKMGGILYASDWAHKKFEFKYNERDNSGASYGMVAFGKSADQKTVDCVYILYKISFKIAPKQIIETTQNSILWGLIHWEGKEVRIEERTLGVKTAHKLQNFFHYKAMNAFFKEGYIDTINYVPSIEDASGEITQNEGYSENGAE